MPGPNPPHPAEATLWSSRPSPWAVLLRPLGAILAWTAVAALVLWALDDLVSPVARAWIVLVAAAVLAAILAWSAIARAVERFTLTDRRLIWEFGILRRVRVEVPLHRVQHSTLLRRLRERPFGLGTLAFATAGTGGYEIAWAAVPRPLEVLDLARAAIERRSQESSVPAALPRIPVIGLAGGIGSGKSEVARILESLGCAVLDSDSQARALLDDPDIRDELVRWWGEGILHDQPDPSGARRVNRAAVARIVFDDPAERARLESLIHPRLKAMRRDRIARLREQSPVESRPRAIVIDAPLLFEAGVDAECDAVIFVDAPYAQRLARVRDARGWDEAELVRREAAQLPLEEKRRRSDHVIENSGDLAALAAATRRVLDDLLAGTTNRPD
jgi:dephospho-CoA kinase